MSPRLTAAVAFAALMLCGAPALAGTIDIDFTGANVFGGPLPLASAHLDLIYDDALNKFDGHYVTGISGDVDGDTVTGLLAFEGPSICSCFAEGFAALGGVLSISNTVYDSGERFDHGGLGFKGAANYYNLYGIDGGVYEMLGFPTTSKLGDPSGAIDGFSVSDGSVNVPEPAGWALMIAGFGLTGAVLRRRMVAA